MKKRGNGEVRTSPTLITNYVFKWLEIALDYGISEWDFWDMTIAELDRAIQSKKRVKRIEQQEKATFDYALADLIGRSVSRIYSSANKMPEISEVYPTLFDNEEIQEAKQAKKDQLSALRFRQFAQAYNKRISKEVSKE